MKNCDVIIIGAGAAGLMAAYKLSAAGKRVMVLEARNRPGGRIHTLQNELSFEQAERGAEFIHGNLPVTLDLLETAKIARQTAVGSMWHFTDGEYTGDEGATPDWELLMNRLSRLQEDCSIDEFLQREFAGEAYESLRNAVIRFVNGYDTANPKDASVFAIRNEWLHEDDDAQHRVSGGYSRMINFLADKCLAKGGEIVFNAVVTNIYHETNGVRVAIANGDIFAASQLVVALPLGILKLMEGEGAITFHPPLAQHSQAFQDIGFGSIIKLLLRFDTPFWEDDDFARLTGQDPKQMAFLLSDEAIPTWWTQNPEPSPILTGWLGGQPAAAVLHATDEELLQLALQSLANIFKKSIDELRRKLVAFNCANWTADPYTRGSYAYDTLSSAAARKILGQPINNTLFFAGEYLYDGPAMGTVEAALTSGRDAANKILKFE